MKRTKKEWYIVDRLLNAWGGQPPMYPLVAEGMQGKGCICYEEDGDGEDGDSLQSGDDAPFRGSCVD